MFSRKAERGDTIVEVLIVIAIVTLVLSGSYASARRSFITTQQTQERAEAIKYLEEQLERLRVAADDPSSGIFGAAGSTNFCLQVSSVLAPSCNFGIDNRYNLIIQRTSSIVVVSGIPQTHYTFRARAEWDRVGGNGQEQIDMYYRIHPAQ